jgi:hypothetical protein
MVLSKQEAEELYFYMRHQYISPNKFPHLHALLSRIAVDATRAT